MGGEIGFWWLLDEVLVLCLFKLVVFNERFIIFRNFKLEEYR